MLYGQNVHPYSSWLWLGGEAGDCCWLEAGESLSLGLYGPGEFPDVFGEPCAFGFGS